MLSFLTTTGFESHDWRAMQIWSDLPDPGTILLGVAVMGGGIATTAGGVKLLRLYALYRHGLREMDRLIHPEQPRAARAGGPADLRGRGAHRLHLPDAVPDRLALVMMALAATGLSFERSLDAGGRRADHHRAGDPTAAATASATRELSGAAQAIFCAAMIVGRMEALVIIALFNPIYWRR